MTYLIIVLPIEISETEIKESMRKYIAEIDKIILEEKKKGKTDIFDGSGEVSLDFDDFDGATKMIHDENVIDKLCKEILNTPEDDYITSDDSGPLSFKIMYETIKKYVLTSESSRDGDQMRIVKRKTTYLKEIYEKR